MDCPEIISLYEQNKKNTAVKAEVKKEASNKRSAPDETSNAPAKKKATKKTQVENVPIV